MSFLLLLCDTVNKAATTIYLQILNHLSAIKKKKQPLNPQLLSSTKLTDWHNIKPIPLSMERWNPEHQPEL